MMKIIQRLLMFAIGLPAVLAIVWFLPGMKHLAVNCIVTAMSAMGAVEFATIIGKRGYQLPKWEAAVLGAMAPFSAMLAVSFGVPGEVVLASFMIGAAWVISSRIFAPFEALSSMADRTAAGLSALIYPGVFMLWITRMTSLPQASPVLLIFLLSVFANDSLAWVFGMLLGAGNRGIVAASPNKSIAGFVGGMMASIGVGLSAPIFFPTAFTSSFLPPMVAGMFIGFFSGIAAIIGDLAESTIKRSVAVKDSGAIIPGRGGVLDSIDSIAFAAPIFYAAYHFFFQI